MKKNVLFVSIFLLCSFFMLSCDNEKTTQTRDIETTVLTTNASTIETTIQSTTEITTLTTETIEDLMAGFVLPVDAENVEESFSLPVSYNGLDFTWLLSSTSNYLSLTTEDTSVEATFNPVELGGTDQQVTLLLRASNGKSSSVYTFEITIKARTTPIADFYDLSENTDVTVGGIVYAVARVGNDGYYIYDTTGCLFVYGLADDVNLGDEVIIEGSKVIYFNIHQLTYESASSDIQVLSIGNPMPEYKEMSVSDIMASTGDYTSLAKNVTFQAKVIRKYEDFMTNYYFEDIVTGEQIFIYYKSAQDIAGLHENQYVEVKATVYDYNTSTDTFSIFLSNNVDDIKQITPNLTDEQKVNAVSYYLDFMYNGKIYSEDIVLVETDLNWESSISWASNQVDVVSNAGLVVLQDVAVDVTITATIVCNDATLNKEVVVTIQPINLMTLKDISEWQIANQSLTQEVAFEAVVVATRGTSGYFVNQNGYGYYVKSNSIGLVAGDKVLVIGTTAYSRQPYIKTARMTKLISSGNSIASPIIYSNEALSSQADTSTFYNSYITVTGILQGEASKYGTTYSLLVGTQTVTIHSASNKVGFSYLIGYEVSVTCFVNRINKDGVSWEIFLVNRDGDMVLQETEQAKLAIGLNYLDVIFEDNSDITTDLRLPTNHPALIDVVYTYSTSDNLALSDLGVYMNPAIDSSIDFTITTTIGQMSSDKLYHFTVKHTEDGYASDLMFTFLLHGITNNKVVSIYNGTDHDVDLSNYRVVAVQNTGIGANEYTIDCSNVVGVHQLSGIIAQGETILLYHSGVTLVILNQIPGTVVKISSPNQNGVVQFNGKDGDILVLQRDSVIVDQIGSFEKVNSQGQKTSWETEFFGGSMLIRNTLKPTPALDWSDTASVLQYWTRYVPGEAPDYLLPSIAWDYLNGILPATEE